MSKMVSARVPDALYDQVNSLLTEMGSSPSELINEAYEYVFEKRKLPSAKTDTLKSKTRKLSNAQRRKLQDFFDGFKLPSKESISSDIKVDKELAAKARMKKYEALA